MGGQGYGLDREADGRAASRMWTGNLSGEGTGLGVTLPGGLDGLLLRKAFKGAASRSYRHDQSALPAELTLLRADPDLLHAMMRDAGADGREITWKTRNPELTCRVDEGQEEGAVHGVFCWAVLDDVLVYGVVMGPAVMFPQPEDPPGLHQAVQYATELFDLQVDRVKNRQGKGEKA
ncbi:hypothetical protein ACN20G_10895 [Streptomyces sp. BI20]|uniref:hypothetical protein n=1 Tax=Streptomyces sp. BI20 TaxID=3403460 RepID=UPI003C74C589